MLSSGPRMASTKVLAAYSERPLSCEVAACGRRLGTPAYRESDVDPACRGRRFSLLGQVPMPESRASDYT
jgi:hypothetical protein